MRIRKNAKLSFSSSTPAKSLQTHVCQLNQSPWDDYNNCSFLNHQFDNSFTGNGSFEDSSIGALDSSTGSKVFKVDDMVIDDHVIKEENVLDNDGDIDELVYCVRSNGKGWQCRNEAKNGHNLCDHHLSLLKSYGNGNTTAPAVTSIGSRRGRGRVAKRSASNKNKYEFYYYSGFGPSWGKRRGEKASAETKEAEIMTQNGNYKAPDSSSSQYSQIDTEEFDFVDDDFDDDEDDEEIKNADIGKKRKRKPVKERSLKSLM